MKQKFIKIISPILIATTIFGSQPVRADMWGADLPILLQILTQTIQQLAQLKAILGTGQDTLGLHPHTVR